MRIGALDFAPRPVPTAGGRGHGGAHRLARATGRRAAPRRRPRCQALLERRGPPRRRSRSTGGARSRAGAAFRRVRCAGTLRRRRADLHRQPHPRRPRRASTCSPRSRSPAAARLVLVNRGWIARSAAYPAPPEVPVPAGEQAVEGLATVPPAAVLELSADTVAGSVWQNLSIERYARARAPRRAARSCCSPRRPAPGLAAVEEKPDAGIAKHREYSLTWFSLAATVVALWVGLNLRRHAADRAGPRLKLLAIMALFAAPIVASHGRLSTSSGRRARPTTASSSRRRQPVTTRGSCAPGGGRASASRSCAASGCSSPRTPGPARTRARRSSR